MRITIVVFCFLFSFMSINAQVENDTLDLKYLEDQLYVSLTYDILNNKPNKISQNGFSGGTSLGFIKDIPLNKQRNVGLGIGLGYAFDAYIQNLKISKINNKTSFDLAEDYKTNKLVLHSLEMPLEFRWRNSTASKYKFWRVYGGMKFSYVFSSKAKFKDETETLIVKNITEINKFQYGISLAAGYSTWNLYIYYGLKDIFKENTFFENEELKLGEFKVGLKFYIL